jgi:hypothetical protein
MKSKEQDTQNASLKGNLNSEITDYSDFFRKPKLTPLMQYLKPVG